MYGRLGLLSTICLILVGCGRGGAVTVNETSLRDFFGQFEVALNEARSTVISVEGAVARPKTDSGGVSEGDEDPPEVVIRGVLGNLVGTAQQLLQASAGHAAEQDVKAIHADAEQLLKKSKGSLPSVAEIKQALELLSAKAEALKSKL